GGGAGPGERDRGGAFVARRVAGDRGLIGRLVWLGRDTDRAVCAPDQCHVPRWTGGDLRADRYPPARLGAGALAAVVVRHRRGRHAAAVAALKALGAGWGTRGGHRA